jgi:hypothetical protein
MATLYKCNFCYGFTTAELDRLLNHVGRCHSAEPNFHAVCGLDDCTRTYTSYHAYRNHVRKHHPMNQARLALSLL